MSPCDEAPSHDVAPNHTQKIAVKGGLEAMEIYPITTGMHLLPTDPLNKIPNPPVIVIPPNHQGATRNTAAVVRITRTRPYELQNSMEPRKFRWTQQPVGPTGRVAFLGPDYGPEVRVYGVEEGEVVLTVEVDLGEKKVRTRYRALVSPFYPLWVRVNVLTHPRAPLTVSPERIHQQLHIANIYLRQVGIRMVLDRENVLATDPSGGAGVAGLRPLIERIERISPGIFQVHVKHPALTAVFHQELNMAAVRLNGRKGILNLSYVSNLVDALEPAMANEVLALFPPEAPERRYITAVAEETEASGGMLEGLARRDWREERRARNEAGGGMRDGLARCFAPSDVRTVTDSGTPSSSWLHPVGLPPEERASPFMTQAPAVQRMGATGSQSAWSLVQRSWLLAGSSDGRGEAVPQTMRLTVPSEDLRADLGIWGMVVLGEAFRPGNGGNSTPETSEAEARGTMIAHEICHVLGLAHRTPIEPMVPGSTKPSPNIGDGLGFPKAGNLMGRTDKIRQEWAGFLNRNESPYQYSGGFEAQGVACGWIADPATSVGAPINQSLDILQARGIHQSSVLKQPGARGPNVDRDPIDLHAQQVALWVGVGVGLAVAGAVVGAAIGGLVGAGSLASPGLQGALAGAALGLAFGPLGALAGVGP